jgi:RNA-directed DNA polymerase
MTDRAVQALYHQALDPVVEEMSDRNSFGFRKYRSAQDALTRIRTLMDKPTSPRILLDADIRKCFDKINHQYLLDNTPIYNKHVLEEWLKSGVADDTGQIAKTEEGTPQGGVISPLLCNIALNGLEKQIRESTGATSDAQKRHKVQTIRYADDFLIIGETEPMIRERVLPAVQNFLRGPPGVCQRQTPRGRVC